MYPIAQDGLAPNNDVSGREERERERERERGREGGGPEEKLRDITKLVL